MGSASSGNRGHAGRPGERGGSGPGGGGATRGVGKGQRDKVIADFHNKWGGAPVEHMILYKDGKVIAESVGNGTNCNLPTKADEAKDGDLVHNHPNDSPGLSPEDIFNSARFNVNSITAVTDDRGSWTVTRPEHGWDLQIISPQVVSKSFREILEKERASDATKADLKKVNENPNYYDEATNRLGERVSERTITALGLSLEKRGSQSGPTHKLAPDTPEQALEKMLVMTGRGL